MPAQLNMCSGRVGGLCDQINYSVVLKSSWLTIIIINNQVLNKIKIAVRISSQKGHKYDKNVTKIWGN